MTHPRVMALTASPKLALKRGALITAANWHVVLVQFIADALLHHAAGRARRRRRGAGGVDLGPRSQEPLRSGRAPRGAGRGRGAPRASAGAGGVPGGGGGGADRRVAVHGVRQGRHHCHPGHRGTRGRSARASAPASCRGARRFALLARAGHHRRAEACSAASRGWRVGFSSPTPPSSASPAWPSPKAGAAAVGTRRGWRASRPVSSPPSPS